MRSFTEGLLGQEMERLFDPWVRLGRAWGSCDAFGPCRSCRIGDGSVCRWPRHDAAALSIRSLRNVDS